MRDPGSDAERERLFKAANGEYLKARAVLLLDRDGRTIVTDLEALQGRIRTYGILVDYQERRVEASKPDAEDHEERLDWHYGQLRTMVDKLVEDCRALVERVAASAGVAQESQSYGQLSIDREELTRTVTSDVGLRVTT